MPKLKVYWTHKPDRGCFVLVVPKADFNHDVYEVFLLSQVNASNAINPPVSPDTDVVGIEIQEKIDGVVIDVVEPTEFGIYVKNGQNVIFIIPPHPGRELRCESSRWLVGELFLVKSSIVTQVCR